MANGNSFSGRDAGHILDTFGYDLINLPPPGGDGNESVSWTLLGEGGSRSGTAPEAQIPEPKAWRGAPQTVRSRASLAAVYCE